MGEVKSADQSCSWRLNNRPNRATLAADFFDSIDPELTKLLSRFKQWKAFQQTLKCGLVPRVRDQCVRWVLSEATQREATACWWLSCG